MPVTNTIARLAAVGHIATRPVAVAVAGVMAGAMTATNLPGARALLLEGPPGAGKSSLASAVAAAWNAPLVACQMHAWTDADEMFVGVNVEAAVAGDAVNVRQLGVLARVAQASQEHTLTVVLLDEIDKAPERAEALLLDWLQTGRVPVAPGEHLTTRLDRVVIMITSNAARPLSDALRRRVRRVHVEPLPLEDVAALASAWSGASVEISSKVAKVLARLNPRAVSPQEVARCCAEMDVCESFTDACSTIAGWAGVSETHACPPDLWARVMMERRA